MNDIKYFAGDPNEIQLDLPYRGRKIDSDKFSLVHYVSGLDISNDIVRFGEVEVFGFPLTK